MGVTPRPSPAALRRTLYLRRRPLAALCAFAAVLATLLALTPTPAPTVPVLAARTSLPAGTVLAAEHLTPVELPESAVPEAALASEAGALGRALSGPVTAGSVLTTASVSSGGRLARPGHVVAALPLPGDGIEALIRPGVRLDVLDGAGEVVAADVPVVAPPDTQEGLGAPLGSPGRTALVEVPQEVAARLVSQGASSLTIVVR